MRHATIQVTADHIEHGQRRAAVGCPIALAIEEQWPSGAPRAVFVTQWWATVCTSAGDYFHCRLPGSAETFIDAFDRDQAVEPFQFDAGWELS